jgi:anti-sigma factor RsiW
MTKTFTQADLIRYLYHEITEEEEREINKALLCDAELRQQYAALVAMKKEMDQAMLEPSDETVENILNHAKQGAAVRS